MSTPKGKRSYHRMGFYSARRALTHFGKRAIDGRTSLGKALSQWRSELVEDLGGQDAISTQQAALIDLCVRSKLLLDSVDAWLLQQKSIVNFRKRALYPVVRERQQLADSLARYVTSLGLAKKTRSGPSLPDYIAGKFAESGAEESPLNAEKES